MFTRELKVDELIRRTEAMTKEEMELVLDHIPVELCLARVSREIERNKAFMTTIQKAVVKVE
jgi:hypothetical protein